MPGPYGFKDLRDAETLKRVARERRTSPQRGLTAGTVHDNLPTHRMLLCKTTVEHPHDESHPVELISGGKGGETTIVDPELDAYNRLGYTLAPEEIVLVKWVDTGFEIVYQPREIATAIMTNEADGFGHPLAVLDHSGDKVSVSTSFFLLGGGVWPGLPVVIIRGSLENPLWYVVAGEQERFLWLADADYDYLDEIEIQPGFTGNPTVEATALTAIKSGDITIVLAVSNNMGTIETQWAAFVPGRPGKDGGDGECCEWEWNSTEEEWCLRSGDCDPEESPDTVTGRIDGEILKICDGCLPRVCIEATDDTATEAGPTTGTFRITRTGSTDAALTVHFTVAGTATPTDDYTSIGTSAVIPMGQTFVDITVTPVDDSEIEGPETVVVTLTEDDAYNLSPAEGCTTATVTIIDDDLPTVTVTAPDDTATEDGPTTGTFRIARTGGTGFALTVHFTITGTATPVDDYLDDLGTSVVIPIGESTVDITVTPVDDVEEEDPETVILTIDADAAYIVGDPDDATVTIVDDDAPPPCGEWHDTYTDTNSTPIPSHTGEITPGGYAGSNDFQVQSNIARYVGGSTGQAFLLFDPETPATATGTWTYYGPTDGSTNEEGFHLLFFLFDYVDNDDFKYFKMVFEPGIENNGFNVGDFVDGFETVYDSIEITNQDGWVEDLKIIIDDVGFVTAGVDDVGFPDVGHDFGGGFASSVVGWMVWYIDNVPGVSGPGWDNLCIELGEG